MKLPKYRSELSVKMGVLKKMNIFDSIIYG